MIHSKEKQNWILWGVLLLFFLMICFGFPSTGDDWNRIVFQNRTFDGYLEKFIDQYQNLNGRILGNAFSFLFIDPIFRVPFKAITLALMMILLGKIVQMKGRLGYLFAFFFLMATPRLMLVQVYGWSAGFFNYVPPMIAVLLLWYTVKPLWRGRVVQTRPIGVVGYFILGFIAALFVEHVTLYLTAVSFLLLIYHRIKTGRHSNVLWAFFLGSFAGTVVMLASPVYREILLGNDDYRELPQEETRGQSIVKNYRIFTKYFLFEHPFFTAFLFGFTAFVYHKLQKGWLRMAGIFWMAMATIYATLSRLVLKDFFTFEIGHVANLGFAPLIIDAAMILITFVFLLLAVMAPSIPKANQKEMAAVLLSIPILVAPLFVVSPVLARNYYAVYLLFVIVVLLLWKQLWNLGKLPKKKTVLAITSLCLAITVFYTVINTANHIMFNKRIAVIEEKMEKKENPITIPAFPFPAFVFGPGDASLGHAYYYEKAKDIEFIIEGEEKGE